MRRLPRLDRSLWPLLVALLAVYAVADLVRHPFLGDSGRAAEPPGGLTVWMPGTEAGDAPAALVRDAARGLRAGGRTGRVSVVPGGPSDSVAHLLSAPRPHTVELVAVTSTTLTDLARDRAERLIPLAGMRAARAQAALATATPVGVLGEDPLAIAVRRSSAIAGRDALLTGLRRAPHRWLFAVGDDTWSKAALAALVEGAGVHGHVRFSTFPSSQDALLSLRLGDVDAVLTTRSAIVADRGRGAVRSLRWPLDRPAPRAWTALYAPASLPPELVRTLRDQVRAVTRSARWHRLLAEGGRTPPARSDAALDGFLAAGSREAQALARVARAVDRR